MRSVRIDSHLHLWDPSRVEYPWLDQDDSILNRSFRIDEATDVLDASGCDAAVLVQSADDPIDTELMLEIAEQSPQIVGVVAYAPLDDPAAVERALESWTDGLIVGVRNLTHIKPDANWLLKPEVDYSIGLIEAAGLTLDVVATKSRQLEVAIEVSLRHPRLQIVMDHLATPPLDPTARVSWERLIAIFAEGPAVSAKLSGLYPSQSPSGPPTTASLAPVIEHALSCFGPERLMYGGDWPITEIHGGHEAQWRAFAGVLSQLDPRDQELLLGATAARVYRLDLSTIPHFKETP